MSAVTGGSLRERTPPGIPIFILVWFGQVVSLLGSGLTGFALGVWVYQQTGSATQLSIILVCTRFPAVILSPIAGVCVDRWDRRLVMLFSDLGAGASILSIAILMFVGHLAAWHICIAMAINSACTAFRWPAYTAATTLLIPKKHFGRASGLVATAEAIAQTVSPVLGALLLGLIKIQGIFLIDFATFIFSTLTLSLVRFPNLLKANKIASIKTSLIREASYGWTYLSSRPGLLGLLIFFAFTNFFSGFILVLTTPLVLSFGSARLLGTVLSVGGIGFLSGSLLMGAWGGPRRRINGVLGFQIIRALCFILAGAAPSGRLIAIAAFSLFFSNPFIDGCSQVIWQSKVPAEVQGRVFAARRMVAFSSIPIAYLCAGPLADYLFEPWLSVGGPLASSIGRLIGAGPGRGIAFLFVIMGFATLFMVGVAHWYPRLRFLEDEVVDAIPDTTMSGVLA